MIKFCLIFVMTHTGQAGLHRTLRRPQDVRNLRNGNKTKKTNESKTINRSRCLRVNPFRLRTCANARATLRPRQSQIWQTRVFRDATAWTHYPGATHGWDASNRRAHTPSVDGECKKALNVFNQFAVCRSDAATKDMHTKIKTFIKGLQSAVLRA